MSESKSVIYGIEISERLLEVGKQYYMHKVGMLARFIRDCMLARFMVVNNEYHWDTSEYTCEILCCGCLFNHLLLFLGKSNVNQYCAIWRDSLESEDAATQKYNLAMYAQRVPFKGKHVELAERVRSFIRTLIMNNLFLRIYHPTMCSIWPDLISEFLKLLPCISPLWLPCLLCLDVFLICC